MNGTKLVIGAGLLIALVGAMPAASADPDTYSVVDCAQQIVGVQTSGPCHGTGNEGEILPQATQCVDEVNPFTTQGKIAEECAL